MARTPKSTGSKPARQVDALKHEEALRKNIPTAEMESFFRRDEDAAPKPPKHYPRVRPLAEGETRTPEEPSQPELIWNGAKITVTQEQMKQLAETGTLTLSDAQLVWRGKDKQDWSDLVVNVPPLYIQEKIHPKAIIDDLKRQTAKAREAASDAPDLFADFNGITPEQRAEFYQHDQHWSNRMILGDSLQVMASLSERESLKGKVQCIYFDPPYGIKFNSNWQVSTQSRDVKDGKQQDISREPEQVKAFRDTWKDGIHSYLTYLRDRLTAMRDLLTESGSIFVQIGDENVHRVRVVLDEVFGSANYISEVLIKKKGGQTSNRLEAVNDYVLWYGLDREKAKVHSLYEVREGEEIFEDFPFVELNDGLRTSISELCLKDRKDYLKDYTEFQQAYPKVKLFGLNPLKSGGFRKNQSHDFYFQGQRFPIRDSQCWKHTVISDHGEIPGMNRLGMADRLWPLKNDVRFIRYSPVPSVKTISNWWDGFGGASNPLYVVQTNERILQRLLLLATDPGDLVLDPTCGSGTTAYVAEQWGRRWITIDTSRVALALARTRLMAARYPWYLLSDSREGRTKEAFLTQMLPSNSPVHNDIRQGFVYERFLRHTSGKIANNTQIEDTWEKWQVILEPLRAALNAALGTSYEEWQIPRELDDSSVKTPHPEERLKKRVSKGEGCISGRSFETRASHAPQDEGNAASQPPRDEAVSLHAKWWEARIARQKEIDASIAARADVEYLYDKPYTDNARVRVAGPFTVESLSPHRTMPASIDELLDAAEGKRSVADANLGSQDFAAIVLDYLKSEGVKQQDKGDRITFESLAPWPGNFIGASGTFFEGEKGAERRAGFSSARNMVRWGVRTLSQPRVRLSMPASMC